VAESQGLNKDGGINFERKRNFETKKEPYGINIDEPQEEPKEERNLDAKELAKAERLNAKLRKAKGINATGFAINGSTIIGALFYLDSLLANPDTLDMLNNLNGMLGSDIDFEHIIATIQGYKAQIIGFAISSQTMVMGYKDTVQKMKDRGDESFYNVLNEELEKTGI
jgi:hypothetical protein